MLNMILAVRLQIEVLLKRWSSLVGEVLQHPWGRLLVPHKVTVINLSPTQHGQVGKQFIPITDVNHLPWFDESPQNLTEFELQVHESHHILNSLKLLNLQQGDPIGYEFDAVRSSIEVLSHDGIATP